MKKLLPDANYFRSNVAFRNDTILGVCEAIGNDVGFNPNFLRVPLAAGIIFAPALMIGIYLALGMLAFASRTFMPDRIERVAEPASSPSQDAANEQVELVRAA